MVAESGEPQRSHLERIATLLPSEASRAELSAIVVGVGPGSYTGIRAASAAAAGVAAALYLPIIANPTARSTLPPKRWVAKRWSFRSALGRCW
jgi:tRNA A37 threonylcarbamoyladenosine modification protein TsaB